MKRIAYFEPVPGLNVYGRELLPYLGEYYQIDVFTDARRDALVPDIANSFPFYSFDDFKGQGNYTHLIFQLRNNEFHSQVYDSLLTHRGVSVFHDVNISGLVSGKTLMCGRQWVFLNEIRRNEGLKAFATTALDVLLHRRWPDEDQYMMNKVACDHSRGIIVHNEQARKALTGVAPGVPISVIERGVPDADEVDPSAARRRLGLSPDEFIVTSLGIVAERKRIPQALAAIARLKSRVPAVRYILAGKPIPAFDVESLIRKMGLTEYVRLTGWIEDDLFYDYLSASDVCVNLRYPVEGETSSVALRSMSYAKPTLVSDAGSMREWPDDVCIKIQPGDGEVEAIYGALYEQYQDVHARRALGERARAYTRRYHTWAAAAKDYHDFLENLPV